MKPPSPPCRRTQSCASGTVSKRGRASAPGARVPPPGEPAVDRSPARLLPPKGSAGGQRAPSGEGGNTWCAAAISPRRVAPRAGPGRGRAAGLDWRSAPRHPQQGGRPPSTGTCGRSGANTHLSAETAPHERWFSRESRESRACRDSRKKLRQRRRRRRWRAEHRPLPPPVGQWSDSSPARAAHCMAWRPRDHLPSTSSHRTPIAVPPPPLV